MQQADYTVVSYRPQYVTQILEIQKDLWGPDSKLNSAYFDWKYLRNPYVGDPLIYMAMQRERVVGMRGFVGSEWEFGQPRQKVVLPMAHDMVVAPDHRNRGLMALIMKAALKDLAEKGYSYVLSMKAGPITLMRQMTMGWRRVGSFQPIQFRVTRRNPAVRRFLKQLPLAAFVSRKRPILTRKTQVSPREPQVNGFDILDSISDRYDQKLSRHVMIEKAPRTRDMAELASRLDQNERIRHVRDDQYYKWGFDNPRSTYRFLYWGDTKMEGYLVLQSKVFPSIEPILIVDWQATSEHVWIELLNSAIQLACNRTLVTWSATLDGGDRRTLEAAGFGRFEQAGYPSALVRPVRDEMLTKEWTLGSQRLLDIGCWDLRMIHY